MIEVGFQKIDYLNLEILELIYKQIASDVRRIAETSGSEAKLQIELEAKLKELLASNGIEYSPAVDESLKKLGFSRVSSGRPDSMFGHVVLDYKEPGLLGNNTELEKSKTQIERYLNEVSKDESEDASKWAGVLWDGFHITFCRRVGTEWHWSLEHETSESSLLSLVQIYRSLGRMPFTPQLLTRNFGKDSDIAKFVLPVMANHLSKPKHRTNLLFKEWKRLFQQVSTYGLSQLPSLQEWSTRNGIATRDASQILFAMHTYYSLVVKLLTAELLGATQTSHGGSVVEKIANAPDDNILFNELRKLENGEVFRNHRIDNFLEGDFFSWYTNEESPKLAECIKAVARTFQKFEPATAKLKPEIVKDLLKEFYSSLVDEQIRHDLGEYYTPDWLAEYLLDQLNYQGDLGKVVVDPACGSGTFIIECVKRVRKRCQEKNFTDLETLKEILNNVRGLDLNPLAVISARANYILAIADLVFTLGHDIEIPIYLADSINIPVEKDSGLLEYTLDTEVGDVKFSFPLSLVKKQILGKLLLKCEEFINQDSTVEQFWDHLEQDSTYSKSLDDITKESLFHFYKEVQALNHMDPPWDSIWCRIVKNNFSPKGFGEVDFIIGNPPWVRWSRLPETYRKRVKKFCDYYGLVSGRGYTGGIESDISTVMTFSAVDHWLKIGGRLGFLITSTVYKSDSATGFRKGQLPDSSGILIERIEELSNIQPFPDASNQTSIYIAQKVTNKDSAEFSQIPCRIWHPKKSARINPSWTIEEVKDVIDFEDGEASPVAEFGSPLFLGKRQNYDSVANLRGVSDEYLSRSHRGTVTDLARVFWVKVEKYSHETNRAWIRTLTKKELPRAKEIEPFEGWIEADLLFPLVRGRDIGRYSIKTQDWYHIVPNEHYTRFEEEDEFSEKFPATYSYFRNYADLLGKRSSYKRYQKGLPFYCIHCVGEYSFKPIKVVWLEQQDPNKFRASVITEHENSILPNRLYVPDHKLYFVDTINLEEAHYLCGYLNSFPVRTWLGGFLPGKQIGTSIFRFMNLPKFDQKNIDHRKLVGISMKAHEDRRKTKNVKFLEDENELELAEIVQSISRNS